MTESPTYVSNSQSHSPSNTDFSEDLNNNNGNIHSPSDSLGDYNDSFHNLNSFGPGSYNSHTNINKKKKASRACFHCQKAHLTCDDSRPCQRCIKRDLAATCADGIRKKAKYLQESYEGTSTPTTPSNHLPNIATSPSSNYMNDISNPSYLLDSTIFGYPDYGFGSEAVNLEYGMLSNMLHQSPTPDDTLSGTNNPGGGSETSSPLQDMIYEPTIWNGITAGTTTNKQNSGSVTPTMLKMEPVTTSGFTTTSSMQSTIAPVQQLLQTPMPTVTPIVTATGTGIKRDAQGKRKSTMATPESVYASVKRPFNYAEGFHYLIKYVQEKMSKDDLMRISRAMALFRPSFIALIMNLTEEDLVFMEKCFQRQLLEYEKLISFSGTPTVVWRRTGEIVLVGKEFSLLTQWGKDLLLGQSGGRKTYIYELMNAQSAVEYWEKFSTHAFDNVESSVMTTCILMNPSNRPVPCTFCFTIKRDIFDLPSVIVGNFLPILS